MNKLLLALLLATPLLTVAETVNLGGTDYEVTTLADREVGPGIRHTRFRLPAYPLNINVLRVDLTNPYNRIETTVANESAKGTELLTKAAQRQSYAGHRAVAGANANFWVVSSQPEAAVYTGTTRGASIRNGVIVTESNQHRDQWDGGTMRTGVVSVSTDKVMNVDYCTSYIHLTSSKFATREIHQVNKGVHTDELCMYNSYYGSARAFLPIKVESGKYYEDEAGDATEVLLSLNEGQAFASNTDVTLTVQEIRLNAGKGTLGDYDVALVGRGDNAAVLATLAVGDEVTIDYGWIYNPGAENEARPAVEQAVGGNALVMRAGELTAHNSNETYNSQVYSRCGYGCSADGKMLYIIVIDKSTDSRYGTSAGCNTAKMCEFARWLGCSNMANFDAGGSAEMFVEDRVENQTTETSPRAVANGWLVYSIAPEDADDYNTVARLEFEDYVLQAPVYAKYTPAVRAYNRYGAVLDRDFTDFTLSCPAELGSCEGNVFTAGGSGSTGMLTATCGDVSVSKEMNVIGAQMSLRIKDILIDGVREYPLEVSSSIDNTVYTYDASSFAWTLGDGEVASIDAAGVLRGLREGTTDLKCSIGDFEDNGTVTVQIAPAATVGNDDWSGWSVKKSTGISDVAISADGLLSYTYGSPRDPYAGLAGTYNFYSLPDAAYLEFTSSVPLRSVLMDLRSALHTRNNNVTLEPASGDVFEANVKHTVALPLEELGDLNDLALYPISVNGMNFKTTIDAANQGAQTLQINGLYGTYAHFSGLRDLEAEASAAPAVTPNPAAAGSTLQVRAKDITAVEIYSIAGVKVSQTLLRKADAAAVAAPATPGLYIVRISSAAGTAAARLIVR